MELIFCILTSAVLMLGIAFVWFADGVKEYISSINQGITCLLLVTERQALSIRRIEQKLNYCPNCGARVKEDTDAN